ncbi:hypothetical protein GGS20DRAFT_142303 [Poronia punctata]|nr:hypothetical protein GGS20DRAFT_142303 [Poronia punctata]
MASVASASPSQGSFFYADSTEDTDSWQHVDANSLSPADYYTPSPSSSFNGWRVVGYPHNSLGASPTAMSPLPSDHTTHTQDGNFGRPAPTSYPSQQTPTDNSPTTGPPTSSTTTMALNVGDNHQFSSTFQSALTNSQEFMMGPESLFPDMLRGTINMDSFQPDFFQGSIGNMSGFEGINMPSQSVELDIPLHLQDASDIAPWAPMNLQFEDPSMMFPVDDLSPQMSRSPSHHSAETSSSHWSNSSVLSAKQKEGKKTDPTFIKKIKGDGKVKKSKKRSTPTDNFFVVTPSTIHQQTGKPNPYECFEAMASQRGRKLRNAKVTLNIRRQGACFCCQSRKVGCNEERPCKNCKKISAQVPQIMCWKFGDFLPVLFPDFIRVHFKRPAMARFISENVSEFYDEFSSSSSSSSPTSTSKPYFVELTSGSRFLSTLTVPVSFFAPKGVEVLQHWHMGMGVHQLDLHLRDAVPLGVNPSNSSQRETLERRAREYVQSLVEEPCYADQTTEPLRGTQLPHRILTLVQRFAQRSQSSMVKRALGIYAAHYVLTRQLCLTAATLARLNQQQQDHSMVVNGRHPPFTTARILNRQVKAVLDEYLQKELNTLFDDFGSKLKPRSRTEWAPCLAAFLVLCLLFESIEATTDTFVVSEAEVALRNAHFGQDNKSGTGYVAGARKRVLEICREIDNLPFCQVAYRFHIAYQTHHVREPGVGSGSGSGSSSGTFNPLLDSKLDMDLEPAAAEMAQSLRSLLEDGDSWHELDFLAAGPILSQAEAHPYPRDVTLDYTGRLLARFLLSFTDEKHLFFDGK